MEEIFAVQTKIYRPLDEASLTAYLSGIPGMGMILGGAPASWQVREVGDGNLNLVFIVTGESAAVVVKQALPYLRLVGESWPLPLERSYFESLALAEQQAAAPGMTPRLLAVDRVGAVIVMEYLTPHVVLRKALIQGRYLPVLAEHLADFLARSLFKTSDLFMPAERKKTLMGEFCANAALCKITEDLVFTDPYRISAGNRWTSPQLDPDAARIRADGRLKAETQALKLKFLTCAEALIHGDLHTGSIMVTETDTRAIDPEFAFFGPMGFDIGALIANLLIAAIAHPVHDGSAAGLAYRDWILDQTELVLTGFRARFRDLWDSEAGGDAFTAGLFDDAAGHEALRRMQDRYLADVFEDALGFAGCKMIRRVVGLAHVEDLEAIADPDRRAAAERQVLRLARVLVLERRAMTGFGGVRQAFFEAVA